MGLIRKIIVVSGALMAMPSPPPVVQNGTIVQASAQSSSWNYISAAAETVADMKSFCERKPNVCSTAQYLAVSLEGKAKYSAKLVYEWANESGAGQLNQLDLRQTLAIADPINTGTVSVQQVELMPHNSTLRMEDLIPEWRGTIEPEKG
jgi:Family of unknown function (DUF5330)